MPRLRPSLPLAGAAFALAVVVAGTILRQTGTVGLGTASPPFVFDFGPRVQVPWLLAAVVAGGAAVAARRRLGRLVVATLALTLSLNAIRFGSHQWDRVLDLGPTGSGEAKNEYLPSIHALDGGVRFFLDRFAELVPALAPNAGAHPPGLLLTLHALGLTTSAGMAALCIAAAVAVVPATAALARTAGRTHDEARTAAALAATSPGLLLLGTTSADAVYALLGTITAALLLHRRTRPGGAVALALAAFFSWALLAAGAFATIVVWRREGLKPAATLAATCAAAVVGFNAILHLATGYDAPGVLAATSDLYRGSVRTERPLWFWAFGSPTAWGVMLGAGAAGGWLAAVQRRDATAIALAAIVVVAAAAGFTAAETERIWLPFVPYACVAAATAVPPRRTTLLLLADVLQAAVIAALFETVW